MKKRIFIILLIFVALLLGFFFLKDKREENKIVVAEVTHSVFYTPFYVAIEKGYFSDNNINIELLLTPGADKVVSSVISNDAQIGLCGPEATIYLYKENIKDYVLTFAGLTKRDGQFIIGRNKDDDFNLSKLISTKVLAGRIGGMPLLNFLNALDNEGIDSSKIDIDTSVDFASLSSSFISGNGDYVNLFEPVATSMEQKNYGYVLASIGAYSGEMPYTAFNTTKSFYDNNIKLIKDFKDAINKGLEFVKENDENTLAETIKNQFPDTDINDLRIMIKRYKDNDSWKDNTFIDEESFKRLEDLMIKNKLLDNYVPYNTLIVNE